MRSIEIFGEFAAMHFSARLLPPRQIGTLGAETMVFGKPT
jgi:hypothetical protein